MEQFTYMSHAIMHQILLTIIQLPKSVTTLFGTSQLNSKTTSKDLLQLLLLDLPFGMEVIHM